MEASCVLSLRMTTIHGKTKSNQLSRIGLTVVFDEYTGTSFINLKTLNHEKRRIRQHFAQLVSCW